MFTAFRKKTYIMSHDCGKLVCSLLYTLPQANMLIMKYCYFIDNIMDYKIKNINYERQISDCDITCF